MKKYKMLFAGESWLTHNMEVKGWDDFSVGGYGTEIGRIHAVMDEFAEITHLPSHLVGEKFPSTMEELKTYDVVILSDVGANTLLLHPLVFTQSVRFPNRLQLLADYVEQGGALGMMGGYMTFQGIGGKGCFVAESCEYTNSFLRFAPTVSVILNVEEDHLDFFKDINDIIHSFHEFAELTPMNGLVVVNHDDPNAMRAVAHIDRRIRTFGTTPDADVYPTEVRDENGYYRFTVNIDGKEYAKVALSVPGRHNMLNALACCAAAEFLGVPSEAAEKGLNKFTGSSRRFQLVGRMPNGATVVDDYAHHPSEMKATLSTAKEMHFDRILCAFQPHTYTRTKALFPEFVDALKQCDQAILAPIYAAREQNTIGIYSSDIAKEVPGAVSFDTFDEIADYLRKNAGPNDLVLTMGAGNINTVGPMLIK